MTRGATIFRVGAAVVLVGHATLACPGPQERPPVTSPDLEIPALRPISSAARAEDVYFRHPPPAVGAKWKVELEASSESPEPSGGGQQTTQYQSRYLVEILAVDGPVASRVKITFQRNVYFHQGIPELTVLEAKAFILDAAPPNVRELDDQAASPDAAQRMLDAYPDLATRERIEQVLPDDAMHVGDRRDDLAAAILRMIHPRAWTLQHGSAELLRADPDRGVFKLAIDAVSTSGIVMRVTGEADVRLRDSRLMHLEVSGSYTTPKLRRYDPIPPPGTFSYTRHVTSD